MLRNICKNKSDFPEGIFLKFSQEYLQFSRRAYPQLFCIIASVDALGNKTTFFADVERKILAIKHIVGTELLANIPYFTSFFRRVVNI